MNGLGLIIIVGQPPKLFGSSTHAEGSERSAGVLHGTRRQLCWPARRRPRSYRRSCRSCRGHPSHPGGPRRSGRCHRCLGGADLSVRASRPAGVHPEASRRRPAWTKLADVAPLMVAAIRHHARIAADTIATSASFGARRAKKVRPEPGDDRHRRGQPGRRARARLCRVNEWVPHSGRRASGGQVPARVRRRSRGGRPSSSCSDLSGGPAASALAAVLIVAAFSLMDLDVLRRYYLVGRVPWPCRSRRRSEQLLLGVLQGIVVRHRPGRPVVFRLELATERDGSRPGRGP